MGIVWEEETRPFKSGGPVGRRRSSGWSTATRRSSNAATDRTLIDTIAGFLAEIGLAVRWQELDEPTRLPGIKIDRGTLLVDRERLHYPGDLLHEAGHLACIPADERAELVGDVGPDPAQEMLAIAWSYAALRHLGLDPRVVFHEGGYRGGSRTLLENFRTGRFLAVPLLQWLGMAVDATRAAELGVEPYPAMRTWVL